MNDIIANGSKLFKWKLFTRNGYQFALTFCNFLSAIKSMWKWKLDSIMSNQNEFVHWERKKNCKILQYIYLIFMMRTQHTLSLMANFVMDSKLKVGLEVEVDLMLSFWSDTKWMLMFPTINQRRQKPRTHKSIHHVLLKRENLWWLCIKLRRRSILYDASRMNYETQTHSIMSEKCLDESMIVECCAWNQQDN